MALDQPYDDGPGDGRPKRPFRPGESGGDVPATQTEPVELRTREEYYEALRAADCGPGDDRDAADSRADHSGWDSIDTANRPPPDATPRTDT